MPFGYVHVFFGLFFNLCGWIAVRRKAPALGASPQMRSTGIAVLVLGNFLILWALLKGTLVVAFIGEVRDIKRADPQSVVAVEIWAHPDAVTIPSLREAPVRISDERFVAEVVGLLSSARMWTPNHPLVQWQCVLALDFGNRKAYCAVYAHDDNGLCFDVYSEVSQGWVFATYRNDELRPVLEEAVRVRSP